MRKGMLVFTYRDASGTDCTAGGLSSRHVKFILTGEGMPEIFTPSADSPELVLVRAFADNPHMAHWRAIPDDLIVRDEDGGIVLNERTGEPKTKHWVMYGGNFVATSDSRFSQVLGREVEVVKVYDRVER